MPIIEVKQQKKKKIKIFTPDKLVLLAQIKGGYNSCKLKNKIRLILYLLYKHNKITKNLYNNQIKIIIIMGDNKLMVITELKTFHFDLPSDAGINLKHEIYSIIKHNELLAVHISMETTFMNTENKKLNEPHKFILNLSQILNLRSSNKNAGLKFQHFLLWQLKC